MRACKLVAHTAADQPAQPPEDGLRSSLRVDKEETSEKRNRVTLPYIDPVSDHHRRRRNIWRNRFMSTKRPSSPANHAQGCAGVGAIQQSPGFRSAHRRQRLVQPRVPCPRGGIGRAQRIDRYRAILDDVYDWLREEGRTPNLLLELTSMAAL